ncbi:hypothetical protein [Mannheimia pernigra]|uniref:hypothetical protein n=1 Tax=Mannheimia pernigra TaxID=111844 RepID=UPI001CEF9ECE|nr:hypothetical protein [Mannheimia pernigra]
MVDLRREGISRAQLSRCFSLNRSTSHRWEKSPPNQTLVWRKQAVDFAENSANGQCAMMPDTIWIAAYAFKPCDLPSTAASPLRTLFSTQISAPNTAAKPFGMC